MSSMAWVGRLAGSAALAVLVGCGTEESTAPEKPLSADASRSEVHALAAEVRLLTAGRGITALAKPPQVRPALVQLGQALAFDKILSGNRDIACMTCHLPSFGTGDGRSLSLGQGGSGLGPARTNGVVIPRNSPAVFNLFAISELFWDGRVSRDQAGNYHTPAGAALTPAMTRVLEFGAVSAQPMFPVLSREEMRAFSGNELAAIPDEQQQQIWAGIMIRLGAVREYRHMFEKAYPGTRFEQMTFAHASNAIAGFIIDKLSFNNSPWDRFLGGNDEALTQVQLQGAKDFMSARCSICHNGPALTDNKFHNVAVAQFGPGKGGEDGSDDFGRFRESHVAAEKYAFRTPPLRNVELTAPYGHDGAFFSLRDFVDHYSESDIKLMNFDASHPEIPGVLNNKTDILDSRDPLLQGVVFAPQTVDEVTEFMKALTDPAARNLTGVVPGRVPSGLPVEGKR
ncbi:MAG TPA: cytochrome c peroxidase [Gemmatimonadales bacterium]|nr:cytochrome c peroxidase [Gemmatimonadales bacterium]